jgi:23S rRNA (uracil1939-C5)-methyltransferase
MSEFPAAPTDTAGAEAPPVELEITDVAHGGRAVSRSEGRVVFAPFGIPGERVEVAVYKARKRYAEGEILRVLDPSPDRAEPACPYFGTCGGCQLQHMSYELQLRTKRKVVSDLLARVGRFDQVEVLPTIPSPREYGYRNSARFLTGRQGDLGYTDWRSNAFLRVDVCPIMEPPINDALARVQGRGVHKEHVRIRHSEDTGQTLVNPPLNGEDGAEQGPLVYELLGRRFRVSPTTFFQVNTAQAERLIELSVERLGPLEGKIAVDAYCGAGAFTRFIAERAQAAIGIEESPSAVADARVNLAGTHARVIEARAEVALPALDSPADAVLLDPPRAGCEPPALDALLALAPERIVYVSCDPATLARDLKTLCSSGAYALQDVQPVDMFPQTAHVEVVATLHAR